MTIEPKPSTPDQEVAPEAPTEEVKVAEAPGTPESPKDSEIASIKDEDARIAHVEQLIAAKKYFVNIKQKKYRKGLTFGANKAKKAKVKKVKKAKKEMSPEELAEAKKSQLRNFKLVGVIVVIWAFIIMGIDAKVFDIGIQLPFDLFNNDNQIENVVELPENAQPETVDPAAIEGPQ